MQTAALKYKKVDANSTHVCFITHSRYEQYITDETVRDAAYRLLKSYDWWSERKATYLFFSSSNWLAKIYKNMFFQARSKDKIYYLTDSSNNLEG